MISSILQSLVSGTLIGAYYALLAIGFAIIVAVTRVYNLAYGELLALGAYTSFWLWDLYGVDILLTAPITILVLLFACTSIQKMTSLIDEPFELNNLLLTFGLALFLQNLMLILWSADEQSIAVGYLEIGVPLGITRVFSSKLITFFISIIAILGLYLLITRSYIGKAMRATSQDRYSAAIRGISVAKMDLFAFCLAAILLGVAAPLFLSLHHVDPFVGIEVTIIAFTITMFAGLARVGPILLGGWLMGIAESLTSALFGLEWTEITFFIILLAILIFRPHGVLGRY